MPAGPPAARRSADRPDSGLYEYITNYGFIMYTQVRMTKLLVYYMYTGTETFRGWQAPWPKLA